MQFNIFLKEKNIAHGVSETHFGSMRSLKKILTFIKSLGYEKVKSENIVRAEQVFSNKVYLCKREDGGKKIKGVDALITNFPNQILAIISADCLPILIYDEKKKVVAAIHGARISLLNGILEKTLGKMKKNFKSNPRNFLVAIGPHIRVCHYFFGNDLLGEVEKTEFKKYLIKKKKKTYFNLTKLAIFKLLKFGVKKENIEDCKICTYCHYKRFFSFRKIQKNKNVYPEKDPRFVSFIGIL